MARAHTAVHRDYSIERNARETEIILFYANTIKWKQK